MRLERLAFVLVLAAAVAPAGVGAATPPAKGRPAHAETQPGAKPSEPGPQHKILEGFVGQWKSTIHDLQAAPAATTVAADVPAPQATKDAQGTPGTAEGKLAMGGRFAQFSHAGTLKGQSYEGLAVWGFDDVINKYTAIWMDSTSPAFLSYVGTYDASKKALTLTARYSDQVNRKYTESRIVVTFVDKDTIVLDQYVAQPVGAQAAHTSSITFKRG